MNGHDLSMLDLWHDLAGLATEEGGEKKGMGPAASPSSGRTWLMHMHKHYELSQLGEGAYPCEGDGSAAARSWHH